jgi:hypothetical protein
MHRCKNTDLISAANKIKGPDLKGEGNDISVETIEITAEGVATQKECDH